MNRATAKLIAYWLLLAAAGCTATGPTIGPGTGTATGARQAAGPAADASLEAYPVFTAGDALDRPWLHFRVWRETEWQLEPLDEEIVISARGNGSASGLGRWVEIDTADCPVLEWSWRVDALPDGADLSVRDRDDVAASLFLAFGDPGSISSPRPVPTIRYAWSAAANPVGGVIDSPYFPGALRTLVVRSGGDEVGSWVTERRNLRDDYRLAFGEPPPEPIQVFALYTDNDHLEEPTQAYYRSASVLCSEPPEGMFQ